MEIQNAIFIACAIALILVIIRRQILHFIDKYRITQFANGFSADYILNFGVIIVVYIATNNYQLTLITFLMTQIMRFIFKKLFYFFPNTHFVNDIALFIWTYCVVYLICVYNNLVLNGF